MLTLDSAQALAHAILSTSSGPDAMIVPECTVERPFGWVFVAVPGPDAGSRVDPATARIILVNKYVHEVLGASPGASLEKCIATYEGILRAGRQTWCRTLGPLSGLGRRRDFTRMLEKAGLTVLGSSAKPSDV